MIKTTIVVEERESGGSRYNGLGGSNLRIQGRKAEYGTISMGWSKNLVRTKTAVYDPGVHHSRPSEEGRTRDRDVVQGKNGIGKEWLVNRGTGAKRGEKRTRGSRELHVRLQRSHG